MNTIFLIDNREALPVRAIPFVTGWTMSPDLVAKALAHADHWITKLVGVCALSLSDDGSYVQTLPKEWDGIIAELENLSNMLQIDEIYEGGNYVAWRRDSVPLLPPACFVWKEEFETAFELAYSESKLTLLEERPGDRKLNYSPLVPKKLVEIVNEGFKINKAVIEKPLLTKERETALKLIIGMATSGYRYDATAQRSEAIGEISRDLEQLGIALDQDTIRRWLREAAEQLPGKPINT